MKIKKIIYLFPILLLFNCSLQKRKYQPGYFFSWNKGLNKTDLSVSKNEKQKEFNVYKNENKINNINFEKDITTFADNKINIIINKTVKNSLAFPDSCDEIIYKDGTEIKAKVIEINTSEIRYKKCNFLEGPTFVDKQNKIFMIKYSNGTSEMFKTEKTVEYYNGKIVQDSQKINDIDKKTNPSAILSLIYGILGVYPLIIIGGILAIIFGNKAIKEIKEKSNLYKGERMAKEGKKIGIATVTFYLLLVLIFFISYMFYI